MKRTALVFCLFLGLLIISFSAAHAQQPQNEEKELNDKIFSLYQTGDFEGAIKAGEKLISLEKGQKDSAPYVIAMVNLARIRRAYYVSLLNKLAGGGLSGFEKKNFADKSDENGDEAIRLFSDALKINENSGLSRTAQTADVKKDLAWLISNHAYAGTKTVDKSRGRIDEAEKLLLSSIEISEETRGNDADETLFAALDAGDFYYKYANFEKALVYYERFIQTYGVRHGAENPELLPALRPYANILYCTWQTAESETAVKRIEAITKKSEPRPTGELDLHLRSKDSVAYSEPIIMEANKKTEILRSQIKNGTLSAGNLRTNSKMVLVPVRIEVDETGRITKAEAQSDQDKLKSEAEAAVGKWTVRPFSDHGNARKMRGVLIYRKAG